MSRIAIAIALLSPLAWARIDVTDFGAAGDGRTDDYYAIQNALDTARDGEQIYFPIGIYKIGRGLKVKHAAARLVGENARWSMIYANGRLSPGEYMISWSAPANNASIERLYVHGQSPAAAQGIDDARGILLPRANSVTIDHVIISHCGRGLVTAGGTQHRYDTLHIAGCYYGAYLVGNHALCATNCTFEACQTLGMFMLSVDCSTFTSCWWEWNRTYALYAAGRTRHNTFNGGKIHHAGAHHVFLLSADVGAMRFENVTFEMGTGNSRYYWNRSAAPVIFDMCCNIPDAYGDSVSLIYD